MWTASRLPEFVSRARQVILTEGDDAMTGRGRLGVTMALLRVLECLPRMLMPGQMILFPVLFRDPMGMRGDVVQFGGPLMVFVV